MYKPKDIISVVKPPPMISEYMPKEILLNNLNDLKALRFVLIETSWWLRGSRMLSLREEDVLPIIPKEKRIVPRLMALWCSVLEKIKAGNKGNGGMDLMNMLPIEVVSAQ